MRQGDRVALATASDWTGVVDRIRKSGLVDVTLDGGGKAMGMNERDLSKIAEEEAEAERSRASDDKSWPPNSMETKVPTTGGTK
jgi:hypothetical protein